jgi:hypothetical protein
MIFEGIFPIYPTITKQGLPNDNLGSCHQRISQPNMVSRYVETLDCHLGGYKPICSMVQTR